AAALLELVDRSESGVLNVAGREVVSRYEFACLVAGAAGLSAGGIRRTSIASEGLDRPGNCALDTGRVAARLDTVLHGARERLGAP
ncbi:MAG: hypothetical protein H0U84_07795, partial [Thermoleophilaceae bacterium]|nr:hypothetical protein [Thermoleophilaceae bacterium]